MFLTKYIFKNNPYNGKNKLTFFTREVIGNPVDPYMIRLIIFKCKLFGLYFHKFLQSDDDCLHDHPWDFITFILKGGYYERFMVQVGDFKEEEFIDFRPAGSVLFRKAEHRHAVVLQDIGAYKLKPAYTFVIIFKGRRDWGFWVKGVWKHYSEYFRGNHQC